MVLLPIFALGQHPFFQNLRSFDGLASDYVYCCFQDNRGYLWFGTEMGVSRYDGYEFENFDARDGLTGNEIFQIFQDSHGRIWMLSYNGELSYFKDEMFYNSSNDPAIADFKSNSYISCFYEADDGTIYFGTGSDGLFSLDAKNGVKNYPFVGIVSGIWENDQHEILVIMADGLYTLENGRAEEKKLFEKNQGRPLRTILYKGQLYFAQQNNFVRLSPEGDVQPLFSIPKETEITFVGAGKGNMLYLGTRNGFLTVNMDEFSVSPDQYLKNVVSSCALIDREGNLWITTLGEGVFMSSSPNTRFFDKESSPRINHISSLGKGLNDELWIGLKDGKFIRLLDDEITQYQHKNNQKQSITEIRVFDSALYVLCKTAMLRIEKGDTSYFNLLANDILVTDDDVYLASKHLVKMDKSFFFKNFLPYPYLDPVFAEEIIEKSILYHNAYCLCRDKRGEVFVGTQRGLFSEFDGQITSYVDDNGEKLSSSINALCYDEERDLVYVGTNSQGLVVIKNNKVVSVLTIKEGLSSNNCQSLLLDEQHNLWIGTARSIDLLDFTHESTPKLINYGTLLNLSSTRILDIEKIGKTLYLATEYGLIAHEITAIESSPVSPRVYIKSVAVNSIQRECSDSAVLQLDHYENSVAIGFTGISYKNLGNITYQYKLEGHQDNWRTTKNRTAVFEALPSGKYTFFVKVINSSGKDSPITSFKFEINKPFWKTLWFNALLFFGLIGTLMLIWFFRIRNIRANYELERQIVSTELEKLELEKAYMRAEQKAGVLQMNPHFLFNSLNTIKGYYAQNKFNEANRFISRFSRLLRRILECNTVLIPLEKELEILDLYLELMQKRYDDMFEFEIKCDLADIEGVELPPMMIQPMVENSVIHGIAPLNKGKVEVCFFQFDNHLICTVTDNGIGFNNSHKQAHQSVGLDNIKDRLNLLSQQFDLNSKIEIISPNELPNCVGTTVRIQFPIKINQP